MSQRTLAKLGFFHFGSQDQSDPVESLQTSLQETSKSETLDDTLLVLPEAFNAQNGYDAPGKRVDFRMAQLLKKLSGDFNVGFVAGLLEESDGERPYNSAYLIDGDVCERLSRKMQYDGSCNYQVSGNCDSPRLHRGVCVAALICMDAAGFNANCQTERHKALLGLLESCRTVPKVLCVPAHFTGYDTSGVALTWSSRASVVIANSWCQQPSVIRRMGTKPTSFQGSENAVRLAVFAA